MKPTTLTRHVTSEERALISFYLDLLSVSHVLVRDHCVRVGRHSARVAHRLHKDAKAAYLGGVFHDIGKVLLDAELFSGQNVTPDEYRKIQEHARLGHAALKKRMMFTSLCCGLHHAMAVGGGYGLTLPELPTLSPRTVKKVLEISEIVAICDFVDAFTTRKTTLLDRKEGAHGLRELLVERFPGVDEVIDTALTVCGA